MWFIHSPPLPIGDCGPPGEHWIFQCSKAFSCDSLNDWIKSFFGEGEVRLSLKDRKMIIIDPLPITIKLFLRSV